MATNLKLRLHSNYSNCLSDVVKLAARILTRLRRSFLPLDAPNLKKKKPAFSFSTLMESRHFGRYDVPTISLIICVVLSTLLQEHAACSPCRIYMDKNTDALLVCSPTLCTESSHNIVKYKRSRLTGSWLH